MKKVLKILGVIVILFIAAIILLPIIFKDDIIATAKEEINKNVNAQVDFGDFDLSIISSFPDFTFSIEEVSVIGLDEFEGVKLAYIGELNLVVDIMSVINGDEIKIEVIEILSPEFNVIVIEEGKANYDIAIATEDSAEVEEAETEEVEAEGETAFKMELQRFEIANAQIVYDDRQGKMYAAIKNLNFLLGGDFTADVTDITSDMSIEEITYKMEGIPYLSKAEIDIHAELQADLANSKYTFTENSFRLNQLVLGLDGWVQTFENDEIDMDLSFNTKETTFKSILSMVPAVYSRDFASVETDGQLALNGYAKGKMVGENYPAFGIDLSVDNAYFKYPDLPKSVDNINIDVHVESPGGDLDNIVVDISAFHFEMASNPFDMAILVKTPMSDPYIKAHFRGDLDLGSVKDVIPLEEGDNMNGQVSMNISLQGNQSTIDEERYEDFEAQGNLVVTAMTYSTTSLPYGITINTINLDFAPKYITLNEMDMMVGRSDFQAKGQVERFIPYVLDDEAVLMARLDLNAKLIDATEFMEEESEEAGSLEGEGGESVEGSSEEEPMEVVEVPGNIDFVLNSTIGKIHLEDYDIDNFKGKVTVKDQRMALENTSMRMLDGNILTSGSYETTNPKQPTFDFNLNLQDFDAQKTVTTFNTIEKIMPLLAKSEGNYSADFSVRGYFDDKMEVVGESLNGKGIFMAHQLGINNFSPLELLADKLKKEELRNPRLDNMRLLFTIVDGKMFLDPFDIKTGNIVTTISGWSAFDQTIEYKMNIAVPRDEFGGAANQAAASVLNMLQQKTGQKIELPETINLAARITGTMDDPKIALDMPGGGSGGGKGDLKKKLEDELVARKKQLEEEAAKLKKEAEERARKEAEKLKKEAEDRARQEVEKKKREAEEAAKKKLEEEKRKAEEEAKKKMEEEAKKKLKGLFK